MFLAFHERIARVRGFLRGRAQGVSWFAFFVVFGSLFSYLPSAGVRVYASPDETAIAHAAHLFAVQGSAIVREPLAINIPWVHPRSWVSQGAQIVPVGFLAWPWVLSFLVRLIGDDILPWIGGLIVLSACWPFHRLLRDQYGSTPAWLGTIVFASVPSVILYANRGLFTNGVILACAVWISWLLSRMSRFGRHHLPVSVFLGFAMTLALFVRPTEAAWIVPWWAWFGWQSMRDGWRPFSRRVVGPLLVGCALAGAFVLFANQKTYGDWMGIGYWMRDNPIIDHQSALYRSLDQTPSPVHLLPFGIDLRQLWWNVRSFLGGLFLPWTILIAAGGVYAIARRRGRFVRSSDLPLLLGGWTVFALLLIYGSGTYHDHIRPGAVAIANSFLRYLLPLACLAGWAFADLWNRLASVRQWGKVLIACLCVLVGAGVYRAFLADDEGLVYTRRELIRYAFIREDAHRFLSPDAIVLSDRSDKIFFPTWRAVSPMPLPSEVSRLSKEGEFPIAYFGRSMSQMEKDRWNGIGLEPQEVQGYGRERLYRFVRR